MRTRPPRDAGFTLLETLIAMVIMAVAVLVIVSALGTLITSNQQHRGHAVAETAAKSYGQAMQAKALYRTTLSTNLLAVSGGGQPVVVADASGLAGVSYVNIDQEVMLVTGRAGNVLTVTRAQGDPTSIAPHAAGAVVTPVFRCPSFAELAPVAGSWQPVAGMTAEITAREWWNPATNAFSSDFGTGSNGCSRNYDAVCYYDDGSGTFEPDIRQECGAGTFRALVTVTTDARYRSVDTTTSVIVRRGGP